MQQIYTGTDGLLQTTATFPLLPGDAESVDSTANNCNLAQ